MVDPGYLHVDMVSLHAGQEPDPDFGARAVAIDQTTSYSSRMWSLQVSQRVRRGPDPGR